MNAKYALGRYLDSVDSLERLHLELHEVLAQYGAVYSSSHVLDGMPHSSNVSDPTLMLTERRASLDREAERIRRQIAFYERIRTAVEEYLASLDMLEEKVIRLRFFGPPRTWDEICNLLYMSKRTVLRLYTNALSRWQQ